MNGPLCSPGIIFAKRMFEKFALAPRKSKRRRAISLKIMMMMVTCVLILYTQHTYIHKRSSSIHFFHCGHSRSLSLFSPIGEHLAAVRGRAASRIYGLPLGFIKILSNFTPRETSEKMKFIKSAAFIVDLIYSQLSENEAPDGDGFCDTLWIHKIN